MNERARQSGNATVWALILFATLALFGVTLYLVFVVAPVEKQMGIVQKIFYFHVPSAYAMYIGFGVSACLMAAFKAFVMWFPAHQLPLINGIQMTSGGLGALSATAPVESPVGEQCVAA